MQRLELECEVSESSFMPILRTISYNESSLKKITPIPALNSKSVRVLKSTPPSRFLVHVANVLARSVLYILSVVCGT